MGRPINSRYMGSQVAGSYTITGYGNFGSGNEQCYLVRQRSDNQFIVARESDDTQMTAFLVDNNSPAQNEFYVVVDKQNGDPTEFARKFTNTRVYTFEGGSYEMIIGAVAPNDAVTANVEGMGGLGVSDVAVSAADSTITASPTSITGDGASTSTITVQAKDSDGNNLNNGGETVVLSTDNGTLLASVVDQGDGTYTQDLESPASTGTATVSGTINGETIGDTATVTFT